MRLKLLAVGALPNDNEYRLHHSEDGVSGWPSQWTHADAAFIAAAKPSTILSMIETLEQLLSACTDMSFSNGVTGEVVTAMNSAIEILRISRDA